MNLQGRDNDLLKIFYGNFLSEASETEEKFSAGYLITCRTFELDISWIQV